MTKRSIVGPYAAPEVVFESTEKGDVFGFGVILYEFATGSLPSVPFCDQLKSGRVASLEGVRHVQLRRCLERCLSVDPEARPSASDLLVELDGMHWEFIDGVDGSQFPDTFPVLFLAATGGNPIFFFPRSGETFGQLLARYDVHDVVALSDGDEIDLSENAVEVSQSEVELFLVTE